MSKPTRGIGDKWIDVCRLLNSRGVEYLVVGGVAMALHGRMRATKDIDVLVPRDVENMRRLLEALEALPMGLARELNPEAENEKVITIIGDDPRVDVLKAAGDLAYSDAVRSRRTATVDGVEIPYVGLRELIRSKRTARDQDQVDARELEAAEARREKGRKSGQEPAKENGP